MDADKPLSEQYRIVAKRWVDADTAAEMLEQTKSAVLAKMMSDFGDIPVSKAEMKVKASEEWSAFIMQMVDARQKAALLKVQLEYIRMKFSEWQSHEATRRHEMRL